MDRTRRGGRLRTMLRLLGVCLVAWGCFTALHVGGRPVVTIKPELTGIGRRTPIAIGVEEPGRGLAGVRVELIQENLVESLADKTYQPLPSWKLWGVRTTRDDLRLAVGRETTPGLRAGEAVIRVTATRAGTWLRKPDPVVQELKLPVRLSPPALAVLSTQHYVNQGGSGVVVYRVGDSSAGSGVRAGNWFFPGTRLPGGGPQVRFVFYGVPYDLDDESKLRVEASDDVGNRAELAFVDKFSPNPYKSDTIELKDDFMGRVVPEILSRTPELKERGSLLENYLQINRDLRRENAEELKRLAARSAPRILWEGAFLPMPNAKVMSAFADRRTYVYQGKPVDNQDHLGFDLAVVHQAAVPASNKGVVALARYFGIYGNAVVIDHGCGLMSLYGHLSAIDVKEGEEVARGQTIGRTGRTGLAGGDHLHFTILVHGLPVNPVEWWDAHWIHDRISVRLSENGGAGDPATPLTGTGAEMSRPTASPEPASRSRSGGE